MCTKLLNWNEVWSFEVYTPSLLRRGRPTTLKYKIDFFESYKKVIDAIIIKQDDWKHLFPMHYGRKFSINCSNLGSKCQRKWFLDMEIIYFFFNVNLYSIKVIGLPIRPHREGAQHCMFSNIFSIQYHSFQNYYLAIDSFRLF